MFRRRRTDTVAACAVRVARSCRQRPAGAMMSTVTAGTAIAAVAEVTADPAATAKARVTAITVITAARWSWQSNGSDDIDCNDGRFKSVFEWRIESTSITVITAVRVTQGGRPEQPAASPLPASLAANPRGQPAGHKATRNLSWPSCLASDNASDPQLALLLY